MHQLIISSLAFGLLLVAASPTKAQNESPVAVRVERVIKDSEPSWRYIRGVQTGRVPMTPGERVLVTSLWERKRKGGKREGVSVHIYEVPSASEAGNWLNAVRAGEVGSGWKVEKYHLGDEAYLSTFQNGRWYSLQFRRNNIVARVSGESSESVRRFARHVASGVGATFQSRL